MKLLLPPLSRTWAKDALVPTKRFLIHQQTLAQHIIHEIGEKELKNKTVFELNPGPGILTRALHDTDADQIIVSEEYPNLLNEEIKRLASATNGKVIVAGCNSHHFIQGDLSDVNASLRTPLTPKPWEEERSDILITGVANGDRFSTVATACLKGIIERTGVFKYGRVNMAICLRNFSAEKYLIKGVSKENGYQNTYNTLLNMFADLVHVPLPAGGFTPRNQGFMLKIKPKAGVRIPPLASDAFFHVVVSLFRTPSARLDMAISRLDPGSVALLDQLDIPHDMRVDDLSFEQLKTITKAYHLWPYRMEKSRITWERLF